MRSKEIVATLSNYDLLMRSGWFDPQFYLQKYPDVAAAGFDPLDHYLSYGGREARQPHPDFNVDFYHEQCRERGLECTNALLHFVQDGEVLGLTPFVPDLPGGDPFSVDPIFVRTTIAREFDYRYYLEQNPDILQAGVDPLQHYLDQGWREGRNPNAEFDTLFYLGDNEDVDNAGVNPFYHFITAGRAEGRLGLPPQDDDDEQSAQEQVPHGAAAPRVEAAAAPSVTEPPDEFTRQTVAAAFDREFYLDRYPDIGKAGVDPLEHFLVTGWREGRDPCWAFDTSYYLENYQDIRDAGVNPFFHYLVAGAKEGRRPKDELAVEVAVLQACREPRDTARMWLRKDPPQLLSATEFTRLVGEHALAGAEGACIAVSHDNYLAVVGGVQNCISDEQRLFNKLSYNYLQFFPAQPLPMLSDAVDGDDLPVTVTLNGKLIGSVSMSRLAPALSKTGIVSRRSGANRPVTVLAIHSMLGHSPEAVAALAEAIGVQVTYFWLHDYSSLCESFTLLRNDLSFCHAPPPDSHACRLCAYGSERPAHIARFSAMFARLNPQVLSPSQAALDVWHHRTFALQASGEHVIDHCHIIETRSRMPASAGDKPVRVGHLGFDKYHKGWATFERVAQQFSSDKLTFHHLGKRSGPVPSVHFSPVEVSQGRRHAMIDAVRKHEIDVVIVWPAWPETYSFVTYEAIAAGALVITHSGSGNVASAVQGYGAGWVLKDEEELFALFESGEVRKRALRQRRSELPRSELEYSGCTASLFIDQGLN